MKKLVIMIMVTVMALSTASCKSNSSETKGAESSTQAETNRESFPKFTGSDFDGKSVDDSMFKDNKVTLLNFWFNGCTACVEEIADLEEFNKKLREKNSELVGVNVEANYSEKTLKKAKEILSAKGASYRNIMIDEGEEVNKYLKNIMAFPTTVLVDSKGKIIGEPILGNINEDDTFDKILKIIDQEIENQK